MRWMVSVICAGIAVAQGTPPKPVAGEYPVHGMAGETAIGAEYLVHTFFGGEQAFFAKDYLVVEVALYPRPGGIIDVAAAQFGLRVNGSKALISPVPAAMVAASLSHPEWSPGPSLTLGAGMGNSQIQIGGPPVNSRPFPTSPPVVNPRPRIPKPENPGGVAPRDKAKATDVVAENALPEGQLEYPAAGYLYFPYSGKTGSIKRVDLVYGDAALKLR